MTWNCQSNPEAKEQSWRNNPCRLQTILQSYSNQGRRQWWPTPVLLPGKFQERRSLVGCHLWGREESDTTERLHFYFSLSCIGGRNGNPLQCFCLENPRDGRAWWAAVYGVTQGRTRLKWLSSSSIVIKLHGVDPKKTLDQWNRIKSPEINPHTYGQPISLQQRVKNKQWRKK